MALLAPFKERPAKVQADANSQMAMQALDERQIGSLVGLLQYRIEIANRLVTVYQENEGKLGQLGTPEKWDLSSYCDLGNFQRATCWS